MPPQELSLEVPLQGARRAPGEGSTKGWKKPQRLSAQTKPEVVLRLRRGEALDLLSRALGIPAARITTWRAALLDAGQEARKKPPLASRARDIGRLRAKRGEATREIALLREKLGRLEVGRPLARRRSSRCARPPRALRVNALVWLASAACGEWHVLASTGTGTHRLRLALGGGPWGPVRLTNWETIAGVSWRRRLAPGKATGRWGRGGGIRGSVPRRVGCCV